MADSGVITSESFATTSSPGETSPALRTSLIAMLNLVIRPFVEVEQVGAAKIHFARGAVDRAVDDAGEADLHLAVLHRR